MLPKVLVMVIAGGSEKYLLLEKAVRATWALRCPPGVDVVFVKGRSAFLEKKLFGLARRLSVNYGINPLRGPVSKFLAKTYAQAPATLNGDECWVAVPDSWFLLSIKTVKALAHCLGRMDFDYVFRTNLGSYVHLERLQHFLSQRPQERFYGAQRIVYPRANRYRGLVFGSGSGLVLSRDLAQALVDRMTLIIEEQLEHQGVLIDDRQFGDHLIQQLKVPLSEGRKQDVNVAELEAGRIVPDPDTYHFYFTGNKDHRAQHQLHQLLGGTA